MAGCLQRVQADPRIMGKNGALAEQLYINGVHRSACEKGVVMDWIFIHQDVLYQWVVLPSLIFASRILDVSIGTVRIIFLARGQRVLTPILGFFEILIWIVVISQVMQNLNNFIGYFAYAGGFAAGTIVGMWLEEKLAVGFLVVRIIIMHDEHHIKEHFVKAGIGVTLIDAEGINGKVKIVYSVIKRRNLDKVVGIIDKWYPGAFYSIEDARRVAEGIFPRGFLRNQLRDWVPIHRYKRIYKVIHNSLKSRGEK